MWPFRRRPRNDAVVLEVLARLERLAELVERVSTLLAERPVVGATAPAAAEACVETTQSRVDDGVAAGHVLFVGGPAGYALLERDGAAPERGEEVDVDGVRHRVVRLGPSPLPGDRRRCAFAERQEPSAAARSSDA